MSKETAAMRTEPTTFKKPELYACIVVRMAEMTGNADSTVIETLKTHRDQVLAKNPFGKKTVEDYYAVTSTFVKALETTTDAKKTAERGWAMLTDVAQAIEAKKHDEAAKKFSAFMAFAKTI